MIDIPDVMRNKIAAVGATAWLDDLPALIEDLEQEWSLTLGRRFDGGTEAYVVEATLDDGTPAVLKLLVPDGDAARHEITTLQLANGGGCAALLRADEARCALLLERLGRPLNQLGLSIIERHEILCATASRLWRSAPDCGLPTGAEKGRRLIHFITTTWEALDRPCSEGAIDDAVACAKRRVAVHDDERSVLVHGDVHQWNTLEAGDEYKLVDPDGLLAEAEYDMGIVMREDPRELLVGDPHDRSRWLAARTGLDETAIWEWGVVERMSTGLLNLSCSLDGAGREMLAVADRVA